MKNHFFKIDPSPHKIALLLIRNPYDALIADYNRRTGGGHVGHTSESLFLSSSKRRKGCLNFFAKYFKDYTLYLSIIMHDCHQYYRPTQYASMVPIGVAMIFHWGGGGQTTNHMQ